MKKKFVMALLTGLVVFQLAGCGNTATEENKTEVSSESQTEEVQISLSEINVDEYVTLGEYKGLEVEAALMEITDTEIETVIEEYRQANAQLQEVTDRNMVQEGDIANIDYVGKKDGVAFDGGSDTGYDLTIGSGSFIAGFEEGLVGVEVGETVDLNLTFPENYHEDSLAGAEVVFTVTVNSISKMEAPELTDEYVQSLEIEGVTTVEGWREYIKDTLETTARDEYKYEVQLQLLEKIMENATVKEAPEALQMKYKNVTNSQMEYQAAYYGIDLESFIEMAYGLDMETYDAEITAAAAESAKLALICKKIADVEGLDITDEELEASIEANYLSWGYTSVEECKADMDEESYRDDLLIDEALELLMEHAVITEPVDEQETSK